MNSFSICTLSITVSIVSLGCGDSTADSTADETVAVVAPLATALVTSTGVGFDAAATQSEGVEPLTTPSGSDADCVTTQLMENSLTVSFGSGCEINGDVFAGSYAISLSLVGGFGIVIEYDDFSKSGVVYNGELSVQISAPASAINLALTVEEGSRTRNISLAGTLTAVSDNSVTLSGSGRYDEGAGEAAFSASNLQFQIGDCYPRAGTLTLELGNSPPADVVFNAQTPMTGEVEIVVSGRRTTATLPSC